MSDTTSQPSNQSIKWPLVGVYLLVWILALAAYSASIIRHEDRNMEREVRHNFKIADRILEDHLLNQNFSKKRS